MSISRHGGILTCYQLEKLLHHIRRPLFEFRIDDRQDKPTSFGTLCAMHFGSSDLSFSLGLIPPWAVSFLFSFTCPLLIPLLRQIFSFLFPSGISCYLLQVVLGSSKLTNLLTLSLLARRHRG